jgi:hypothetical protein
MVVMFIKLLGAPIFNGKYIVFLKHNTNLIACCFSMETILYFDLKHIQGDSRPYSQSSEGCWGDNLQEKMEINCYSIHYTVKLCLTTFYENDTHWPFKYTFHYLHFTSAFLTFDYINRKQRFHSYHLFPV